MGATVSILIKVRRELVELANRMVELGLARSRFHAFNIMIEKGLRRVVEEVELWEGVLRRAEELERQGFRLRHSGLGRLLEEERDH